MRQGDKVWSWKDGKHYTITGFGNRKIGARDVMTVKLSRIFKKDEVCIDEVMVIKRKADTILGHLFGV